MKKTITFLCVALFAAVSMLNAQSTVKAYHFIQDFTSSSMAPCSNNTTGALVPAGWQTDSNDSKYADKNVLNSPYGTNSNFDCSTSAARSSVSNAGGNRGAKLTFPTPQKNPNIPLTTSVDGLYYIEFDCMINVATVAYRNAFGIVVSDSVNTIATPRSIFGIYATGNDGFLHVWNKDLAGPFTPVAALDTLVRVFDTGAQGGGFRRAGTSNDATNSLNASTITAVKYAAGNTYHITAGINFNTQKVASLTITNNTDGTTETMTGLPFIDNNAVALGAVAICNTRGNNTGTNGNTVYYDVSLDNMEVYILTPSKGQADVTIKYVNQNNVEIKTPRIIAMQEVGLPIAAVADDKLTFINNGNYYAYDAGNTPFDNLLVNSNPANNVITLHFLQSPLTSGVYVWNGTTNANWSELDPNFTVGSVSPLAYQSNNDVQFSDASVFNKEIVVSQPIQLADGNMSVTAGDYTFTSQGLNNISGLGTLNINLPASSDIVTLGAVNNLEGGANVLQGTVVIANSAAAKQFNVADGVNMILNSPFGIPVSGNGGALNVTTSANNTYAAFTGLSTLNINIGNRGRETSNSWTTPFTSAIGVAGETATQVNVMDAVQDGSPMNVTYAIDVNSVANAKVNLGDNTRIIFNSTPGVNSTTTVNIGELTGTASSSLQGNCVGAAYDRILAYSIGALNTNAVFNGSITPQLTKEPGRRSWPSTGWYRLNPGKCVWTPLTVAGDTVWYLPSTLILNKVGTGTWTVGGEINIPDETSPSKINVNEGTLELLNSLLAPPSNLITLTVNAGATLKTHGNYIGAYTVIINGTVEGGAEYANSFSLTDPNATLKLNVNSFAAGNFDVLKAYDITMTAGALDITVTSTAQDQEITILEAASSLTKESAAKVLVNGVDITAHSKTDPIPAGQTGFYYFIPGTDGVSGILGVKGTVAAGFQNIYANKEIKSVACYNLLGQQVNENNAGITLKKITYADGSVQTIKFINKAK